MKKKSGNERDPGNVGLRIRLVQMDKGLTQSQMADELGASRSYFNEVVNGKTRVPERLFRQICAQFFVNETWLKTGRGERYIALKDIVNRYENSTSETDIEEDMARISRFTVTDEMIEQFPELKSLLAFAEDSDREGFERTLEYLAEKTRWHPKAILPSKKANGRSSA